jgi:hypothetical protein
VGRRFLIHWTNEISRKVIIFCLLGFGFVGSIRWLLEIVDAVGSVGFDAALL